MYPSPPTTGMNGNGFAPQLLGPDGNPIRSQRPLTGPDGQPIDMSGFSLPHVLTFSSILNLSSHVYSWRWDEAYKHSRENALSMRRDCFLMGLLRERQLATAQLNWHLEPESKRDPKQREAADYLTRIVKCTPRLQRMTMALLEAIWYGRYGSQLLLGYKQLGGQRIFAVTNHQALNGDKIQFRYRLAKDGPEIEDGTPVVLVHAGESNNLPNAEIVLTDRGRGLLLRKGYWRERFIIHQHEVEDADFFEAEVSGGLGGIGIRSRIYWLDWLRKEYLSWIADYIERVGMGVLIFYYEAGNPASEASARDAANKQSRNSVIVWPRPIGSEKQGAGVERIEVPMSGSEILLKLQEHIEQIIERYIIGQTLSGHAQGTGLGSGVADLHADTKYKIVRFDAQNLEETLTTDLVEPLKKWNIPWADFPIRWVYEVDRPNAKEQLEGAKTLFEMGVGLDAEEVRGFAGLSKPEEGAELIEKQPEQPPGNPLAGLPGGDRGQEPGGQEPPADQPQDGQPALHFRVETPDQFLRGGGLKGLISGLKQATFKEADHPRASSGEFTSKGGEGSETSGGGKTKKILAKTGAALKGLWGKLKLQVMGGRVETPQQKESRESLVKPDTTPRPTIPQGSYAHHIGEVHGELRDAGAAGLYKTDLHHSPELRAEAIKSPNKFDDRMDRIELRLNQAMHFTDQKGGEFLKEKLVEIKSLRADVDKFRKRHQPEVVEARAAHFGTKGAAKINIDAAIEHLAEGGDAKSAVAHVMKHGSVKEATAKRYVRAAIKQAAKLADENILKLREELKHAS